MSEYNMLYRENFNIYYVLKISTFVECFMNIEGTLVRTGIEWKQALLILCLYK